MCGAVRGEHIARRQSCSNALERTGTRTLGGLSGPAGMPRACHSDRARWTPFDTLGRRRRVPLVQLRQARERSPSEISGDAFIRKPWKGRTPREQPAVGMLIACSVARDSRKGQSPGVAARRSGLKLRPREQRRGKRQVGALGRKRPGTFREGNASKGESQERRRYETGPSGSRREEPVERVAKP
jgi:hypothetical protein